VTGRPVRFSDNLGEVVSFPHRLGVALELRLMPKRANEASQHAA
jgi:hypothetical protein